MYTGFDILMWRLGIRIAILTLQSSRQAGAEPPCRVVFFDWAACRRWLLSRHRRLAVPIDNQSYLCSVNRDTIL